MPRRLRRSPAVLAAVVLIGSAITGCSTPQAHVTGEPTAPASRAASAQQLPPIMADLKTVGGSTVSVPLDNVIVLTGDDTAYKSWAATIADPTIVSFTPGKDDGSAQFNPGLSPITTGTTTVTLDNSVSGAHVVFTVEVTPVK